MDETNDEEKPVAAEHEARLADAERLGLEAAELWQQKRFAEAGAVARRELGVYERLLGPTDIRLASPLRRLGNVCYVQERYRKAYRLYRRAAAIYQDLDPRHPELPGTLYWVGRIAFERRRYRKAAEAYERAVELLEGAHPDGSDELRSRLMNLAHLYYFVGKYSEAEPVYLRGLAMAERLHGPDSATVAHAAGGIAVLYRNAGALGKDPEPYYRRAAAVWAACGDEEALLEATYRLADFLHGAGRDAEAEPLYRTWLELLDRVGDRVDATGTLAPGTRWMKSGYLTYLRASERSAEADALDVGWGAYDAYGETVCRRVQRLEAVLGPGDPKLATALVALGNDQLFDGAYAVHPHFW